MECLICGSTYTYIANYHADSGSDWQRSNLYLEANKRYVDKLSSSNSSEGTKGEAYAETAGWYGSYADYPSSGRPIGIRINALGYRDQDGRNWAYGNSSGSVTYRPAIWN